MGTYFPHTHNSVRERQNSAKQTDGMVSLAPGQDMSCCPHVHRTVHRQHNASQIQCRKHFQSCWKYLLVFFFWNGRGMPVNLWKTRAQSARSSASLLVWLTAYDMVAWQPEDDLREGHWWKKNVKLSKITIPEQILETLEVGMFSCWVYRRGGGSLCSHMWATISYRRPCPDLHPSCIIVNFGWEKASANSLNFIENI